MAKRKKISKILLSIGIVFAAIILILIIIPHFWPQYKCKGHCSGPESDAMNIAASIADYFADPEHMHMKPGDLDDWFQTENPWTFIQCGNKFYIYVYDLNEDCPIDYQKNQPGWDSSIYTYIME